MYLRFFKNFFLLLLTVFVVNKTQSQQSEFNLNKVSDFNHAVKLYNDKAYAAAQKVFKEVALRSNTTSNLSSDSDYYAAMCAVKLNQTEAENLVLKFVENHPNSNKKELAFLTIGNYYFSNRKAAHALKWYGKVNQNLLSTADQAAMNFKIGYSLLTTGNLNLAKKKFLPLINNPRYGNQARYYYGFIAYKEKDYDTAEKHLTEVANEQDYKNEVTYYLLDISFKAGRFEKCVEVGKSLLPKASRKEKSEISKIVGESYFNLKKYAEAIPYLRDYKGKKGKWNNTDYYQLGYAYYKQNDFENAVRNFNKIIGAKNSVAQNAYYHLAECYLYLEKKPEALNAFKSASEMDFDLKIKEDASLNYAKLSYEEGNPYKSVAEVLQDFIKAYPKSTQQNEIKSLIVTSYLYQQDYQGALNYLSKNKNQQNKALTNEISFYRGVQLFNQNKLDDAYSYFQKALTSTDIRINSKAQFWIAEIDFRMTNYQDAIEGFSRFKTLKNASKTEEKLKVDYNIAYSHFKLKQYEKAAMFFSAFVSQKNIDNDLLNDANIRLADCYFVSKNYDKAIHAYNNVIKSNGVGEDYAQYQKAISFGFIGQNNKKIENLLLLISSYPNTTLQDDALFQLANTYVTIKDNENADKSYNQLLNKHTRSIYVPKTLLRQGLLYYNDNLYQKALQKFKLITSNFPNTNEAREAVANVRNVYVDIGDVDSYASWVKNISFVNVSDADLDNTMYESAENKFLENDTEKAIDGFVKYTLRFPEGLHAIKANFYAAQLLHKTNQKEKALKHYQFVTEKSQNEFTEESLNKLAQLYLENENWTSAMPILSRLEQEANYPQNIVFAQSNLMKGYYQSDNYKDAVLYAEKVLSKEKIDAIVISDATIIIARSAFKTTNFKKAEEFYSAVEKTATGELKAEALYYNAFFKNQHKNYKASNKVIQNVIANYSTYKYWGVKSYVVMAKNHYGLKDAYQATFILENIIKNFSQFDDIIIDAKQELKSIQAKEAKTNDSVDPEK